MLKIEGLTKKYNNEIVFEDLNYSFKDNGFYSIVGESGSGKSTLLNLLSLIEKETNGNIFYFNKSLNKMNEKERRLFRINNIGFVFQSFNLFEEDNVYNNINLAFNGLNVSRHKKERKIDDLLYKFDVSHLKYSLVKDLSGGEKQRVAIVRALINNPSIILADEPSGSLDSENSKKIFSYLRNLSLDHLVIVVTHNKELAYKYSDYILKLEKDGLKEEKIDNEIGKERILLSKEKKKMSLKKINFSFIVNHFKMLFKSKKVRTTAIISFLSFSLLVSGLTFYLKDGLTNMIVSSFEGMRGENALLLKRKEDDAGILSYYSASFDDVVEIMVNNPDQVDYVGCSYLNNLEEFFIEENDVYFLNYYNEPIKISDYSATSFNEFQYVSTFNSIGEIYPRINNKIKQDEIVISLSNEKMVELCKKLKIKETYNALGEYIENKKPSILLKVRNNYWTYDDEQIFSLRGVIPGRKNIVYSNDYLFNEYVFENLMMFPSSNEMKKEEEYPWILKKVYYIHSLNFPSTLLNKLTKEVEYRNYIFDGDKKIYHPSLEENEYSNRIYCYQSLKNSIDLSFVDTFANEYDFSEYYYSTDGGYVNFGSILNGFYRPTFFSLSLNKINEIIDLSNKISYEEYYSLGDIDGVAEGNYLKQENNTVRFNPKMNKKIKGNYPLSDFEIAISKGMAKILNNENVLGKTLYVSTITSIKENEDSSLIPEFKTIELRISGVVEDNKVEIYHKNDFSLSLFRDLFLISAFELNVNSVTFLLDEELNDKEIEILNSKLNDYEIIAPLKEINNSLNETMDYVFLFLLIFSAIALLSSIILFSIINYITFLESKKDIAILIMIGFSNFEIVKYFLMNNLFNGIISFSISLTSLISISFLMKILSTQIFGIATDFYFSLVSIFVMIVFLLLICLISLIIIAKPLRKLDLKKELH